MSASQLPLSFSAHRNQQLFSDHYLNTILPQQADWQQLADDVVPTMQEVTRIFAAYRPSTNEAQTEDGLIKPILAALGHTFEVQAALKTYDGTKKPDYIFYRDVQTLNANKNRVLDDTLPRQGAFAVGDAKYWDRPLDTTVKTKGGDPFSNKNPGFQIAFYMQNSGVAWGILTNGRLWRLYHMENAFKLDRYYEIDLSELLAANNPALFLYFYAFFRRAAFDDQGIHLDAIRRASSEYARGISENVKEQVYTALRHLAQGFLDYSPNQLQFDTATLKTIYDNSLIVLYRLLFIFYAEARDLLPLRESPTYRAEYSLDAIKREVARRKDTGPSLLPNTARLWAKLKDLFQIIDQGSPPLQVATFNGGLFDPVRHAFLDRAVVGDARLQEALDLLARVDTQFVDYRDLAERHLGTIYEGLLEYHLAPSVDEPGWTVAILNDKGERHRTGSYYTPEFVVQYIIDQTLGPVLRAAVADKTTDAAQIAAVLAINVCDPATGSGHFPVAATEYIARFLVDLAVVPDDAGSEPDLIYWKRRVAQSCIYGVDLNPLAIELAKLSLWLTTVAKDKPLSFLDHHLRAGNALVGAHIKDLKMGSEGVGAQRKKKKQAAAGQLALFDEDALRQDMRSAVGSMHAIEGSASTTVAEVKAQERAYAELRELLMRKYGRLANLVTATYFGVTVDKTLWNPLADYATGRILAVPKRLNDWLDNADAIATNRRFFHWELEFPEVFFDADGRSLGEQAGFDAVIGNPPYVRQEQLAPIKPYLQSSYSETYQGAADLYVYFYQQGLQLLQAGGRLSYIVTNKWLRAGYGEPLRGYFADHSRIEQLIDFGHAPIFEDADVFPCIIVVEKPASSPPPANQQVQVIQVSREALRLVELGSYVRRYSYPIPQRRFGRAAWSLETSDVDSLMEKIKAAGVPLAEFAGVKPYYGIKTGLNEAFLIDTATKERLVREDSRCTEIIKPYLRGQDIKRWSSEWERLWMIVLPSSENKTWPWSKQEDNAEGIFRDSFPSLYNHLKSFEEKLQRRQDKGNYWWELRSCSYYHVFEQPKLIHTDITWRPQFAFADTPIYLLNTAYVWPITDMYALAAINSPLLWAYMWRNAMHGKDEALRLIYSFVETLPIAPPPEGIRAEVEPAVERLIAITQAGQEAQRDTLDWLRTEFNIETPGQKLEGFASLNEATFIEEVRKRRPKSVGTLTPATLRALRAGYVEQATPVQQRQVEAQRLERRLADLVNQAYGLTPEDIDLLWRTAPPRMPVGRNVE